MKLQINRLENVKNGTIGSFCLVENNKTILSGYTLEPSGPDTTTPNLDRRIPQGLYSARWRKSPKFKETLPILSNESVSESRCILIHAGNYHYDTSGCIILGARRGKDAVFNSRKILKEFKELLKFEEFEVEIKNVGV